MKKTTKIIIVSIVAAILLLGIGYAAITNITLNIGGTLEADPNQANFDVGFDLDTTPTVSNASKVTATLTDKLNATIEVKDLTVVGESATATYTVKNASADLSADLAVATTNDNEEHFTIKAEIGKTSLTPGDSTTVIVTATLTKAPITESVEANVTATLTAIPVQPGEEGTGGSNTPEQEEPDGDFAACGIEGHYVGDGRGEHGIAVENCSNSHTYTCECEGWTVPEGGTYTMPNAANKTVYTEGEHLPCGYETVERRYI
jgi:hypothetical protein